MTCAEFHIVKEDADDEQIEENDKVEEDLENIEQLQMQKNSKSTMPEFMNIAASPLIKDKNEKNKRERSKVLMKRHQLYSELKQIPVHVEQSSCV